MRNYLLNAGDALSQLGNTLIFGGEANHSISGDAYRLGRWRLMFLIDTIFRTFGQRDHCKQAYEFEVLKARQLIAEHERTYGRRR